MTAAVVTVAFQLAGKATRDAFFLSTFGVAALPRMLIASAVVSAGLTIALARVMGRTGPSRLVPRLFLLSGALLMGEWLLAGPAPRATAILFYLHYAAFGALLVSGFWAMVSERFDPRAARGNLARITAGASLGGLLGGLLPERIGASFSVPTMLPILAALHIVAAALVRALRTTARSPSSSSHPEPAGFSSARRVFRASPYLQALAALVLLTSSAEGLLDYVFKARATGSIPDGATLLRLFAVFYTATSVLTILVQLLVLRPLLARGAVARGVALLPAGVSAGALGSLLLPGLGSVISARGIELVLRNSVFRSAYEMLFIPVSPPEKRATKLLLDVGAARVGDVAGAILVQAALVAGAASAGPLLGCTILLSLAALLVARRLHLGYVGALERSLQLQADGLGGLAQTDAATVVQSFGGLDVTLLRQNLAGAPPADTAARRPTPASITAPMTPAEQRRLSLSDRDPDVVRQALLAGPLESDMVDAAIGFLAWDEVARDALGALDGVATAETARLVAHLLDRDEDFAVRRRLVQVFANHPSQEAFGGLVRALEDPRFEVRYRAGRALTRMVSLQPGLEIQRETVIATVLREVAVERGVWESRQLLDQVDEDWSAGEAEVVRDRATRSLEHVFTLLSLILPAETVRLAFYGIHTNDPQLRGTALEYLETVLPEPIRDRLWPFLELERRRPRDRKSGDQALEALLASRESIMVALAAVRKEAGGAHPPTG